MTFTLPATTYRPETNQDFCFVHAGPPSSLSQANGQKRTLSAEGNNDTATARVSTVSNLGCRVSRDARLRGT
jgi:hypothetical protein